MINKRISIWDKSLSSNSPRHTQRLRGDIFPRTRKLRMERLEDRRLLTSLGVVATDSGAAEGVNENYGTWQISRSGPTDNSCTVNFRLDGSATTNDYVLCTANGYYISLYRYYDSNDQSYYYSGSATINAGASSVGKWRIF